MVNLASPRTLYCTPPVPSTLDSRIDLFSDLQPAKVEEKKPTKVEEKKRYNTLRASPAGAKYKLAVVQFKVPGAKNGGSDKGPDGNRVDSIPIANSIIKAGGACDLLLYDATKHEDFVKVSGKY
eukprot:jgi/Chrpa1/25691/Chrysochromulina_OHIO_Genome00023464-RA